MQNIYNGELNKARRGIIRTRGKKSDSFNKYIYIYY